jgi:hypothetical protein
MSTAWTFITVLLGSSVSTAIVTATFQLWTSRRQRELSALQEQVSKLYGPLFCFTSLNQELFDLYADYLCTRQ